MKKSFVAAILAIICVLGFATPASAQLHFGPKVGLNINKISFDKNVFSGENRAGFTFGLMAEFTTPVVGIGADASVMYVRRNAAWMESATEKDNANNDYLAIPINLKWKIGNMIPGIKNVVNPYVLTGPEFAFLLSDKTISNIAHLSNFDVAWNVGAGVELFNKVQVTASYGFGMTKAFDKVVNYSGPHPNIEGKNKYWTVTAAVLF